MLSYIIKRILWMIPVLLGVLVIVFTINYFTPGDPALAMLGTSYTPETYEALRAKLGLDQSFFTRLFSYIWDLITKFDLGRSYSTSQPVATEILARFPVTLKLGLLSVIVTVSIGVPLGILSSTKQYSVLDYSVTSLVLILAAIPNFVLALFSILIFSVKLQWLPIVGIETWKAWILPVAANSLLFVAIVARITRTSMLEVIRQDYIRTARSKGLKEGVIVRRHALPNAMVPVVTVIGVHMSYIMAGSIIVETIFAIPGMGMYLMSGINQRDYPVINGTVLMLSLVVCVMNLLIDILYAFIDPRIKAQYVSGKKKKTKQIAPKKVEVA